ncbi:MAG TPA: TlpA disulfide reductase family protein [Sphingomicrobium sp.]|nr:TlpA disulfide reductase family protein [Sphingomicrobium sp.]
MRLILLLLALAGLAACDREKAQGPQGEAAGALAPGEKGVDRSRQGQAAPDALFRDPDGGATSLAEFEGEPVLVNLWASWCAPCIRELPTLERLEQEQADSALAVIAVSQDRAPRASVDAFLADKRIGRFAAFHDPDMALSAALGVEVMPTTVLFDSGGREVWRYVGDLDWTGAEAAALLAEVSPAAAR